MPLERMPLVITYTSVIFLYIHNTFFLFDLMNDKMILIIFPSIKVQISLQSDDEEDDDSKIRETTKMISKFSWHSWHQNVEIHLNELKDIIHLPILLINLLLTRDLVPCSVFNIFSLVAHPATGDFNSYKVFLSSHFFSS